MVVIIKLLILLIMETVLGDVFLLLLLQEL
nr:MAG TPA: hypothetical protein [Crassvirales sp.]